MPDRKKPVQPKPPTITELPTNDAIAELFPPEVVEQARAVAREKDRTAGTEGASGSGKKGHHLWTPPS